MIQLPKQPTRAQMPLCILIVTFLWCISVRSYEYVYPVGHTQHDGFKLLLLYQKSIHHVELWQWDPATLEAGKALLSSYTPAGIALLPDYAGYSFIDNDTIRVAYTHKRSPMLIPLYEPLYDFTIVQWLDRLHCILSAKEQEHAGIYIVNVEGQCWQIVHDASHEYKYPNLIGNQLFWIEQDTIKQEHRIVEATIDLTSITTPKNVTAEDIFKSSREREQCSVNNVQCIVDCKARHIAFLNMQDPEHGFYLEHPARIDRHDMTLMFSYHYLQKQNNSWQDTQLFTFLIPTAYLITGEERLYESILPFLPRIIGNSIYYCNCTQGSVTIQLYRYNMLTNEAEQLTSANQSVMGAYHHQNNIWYGGVLQDTDAKHANLPSAWVDLQGQFCVHIPKIEL